MTPGRRELPGYYWDEAKQRYFKALPGKGGRAPSTDASQRKRRAQDRLGDAQHPPAQQQRQAAAADLSVLLHRREAGLCHRSGLVDALPGLWRLRQAAGLHLRGWCAAKKAGSFDAALLPLSLPSGKVLLAGGTGTGAVQLMLVHGHANVHLSVEDDIQRRAAVQQLVRIPGPGLAADTALVATAWLGSGDISGVVGVSKVRLRQGMDGGVEAGMKELANFVLRGDVWSLACGGADTLAAGVNTRVVEMDLQTMVAREVLRHAGSDALALATSASHPHSMLCGLRNGAVLAVDTRQSSSATSGVCSLPAAVTSLSLREDNETYLLACSVDGTLGMFDARKWSAAPCVAYRGHMNSASLLHRHVAHGCLLAAPGEDGRVRLWDVNKGGPPLCESCAMPDCVHQALAFDEEGGNLWLGSWNGLGLASFVDRTQTTLGLG
jgi:hypothetical protein